MDEGGWISEEVRFAVKEAAPAFGIFFCGVLSATLFWLPELIVTVKREAHRRHLAVSTTTLGLPPNSSEIRHSHCQRRVNTRGRRIPQVAQNESSTP